MFLRSRLSLATGLAGLILAATGLQAYTPANADTLMNSYNNAFYVGNNGNGYFKNDQNGGINYFWGQAEEIEGVEDAWDRTGNYGPMITSLLNGFGVNNGTNWSWNIYNDDICWACIAYLRGYQATGNETFRSIAKSNFDMMYARAWDGTLGGGLYWTTDKREKNACINGPAAITAYLLYQTLGDSSYLTKAQNILAWEKAKLFNAVSGAVYDNMLVNGTLNTWASTYNQGTFVGACHFLGDVASAKLATDYTMKQMGTVNASGFRIMPEYGVNGNNSGFNAIGLRWIARFVKERSLQSTYLPWLQANAQAAWDVRRTSDNLSWCQWLHATPSTTLMSWDCISSVVALQVVPAPGTTPAATVYRDCNYTGLAIGLPPGDYNLQALRARGVFNDDISSLKVGSGYKAVLYWDDNFAGSSLEVTADNSCLVGQGWNDKATSLKVMATSASWSTTLQAEAYVNMAGVATEACTEGGSNVGWIDAGDWMVWDVNLPAAGTYTVSYRVASPNAGGRIQLEKAGGSPVYGTVTVPTTGGWQAWQTVSNTVTLPAGQQQIAIAAPVGGYNLNWIQISR